MSRQLYLDLAARGRRLPIATHLVLHESPDPDAILLDGGRLAAVLAQAADRFDSPLALPVMDLGLEKELLLRTLGLGGEEGRAKYHFEGMPPAGAAEALRSDLDPLSLPRIAANVDAIAAIAAEGRLVPIGMGIGPFSLLSKLVADPITSVYMAGTGLSAEEDEGVAQLQALMELVRAVIAAVCRVQLAAGAEAMFICEPAANIVYFSPNQIRAGSDVFESYVIGPNLEIRKLVGEAGADLIFHDCGELAPEMIEAFGRLDPVMLSLGSPVDLASIEPLVARDVVLYGNLPTKKFYSDADVPLEGVRGMADELASRLGATGHPFILGSECDVLAMPGYEASIMRKLERACACRAPVPAIAART